MAVYTAGKCGAKKGGLNELVKLRSGAIAERSNFDLVISSGWGPGFLRPA